MYRAVMIACAAAIAGCSSPQKNPYFASTDATPVAVPAPQEREPEIVALPDVAAPILGLDLMDQPAPPIATNAHAQPQLPSPVAPPTQVAPPRWGSGWIQLG